MSELFFEWDAKKASSNAAKHGVTFEEAKSVFYDADALIITDPDHSAIEERFVMMGQSARTGVLVVAHLPLWRFLDPNYFGKTCRNQGTTTLLGENPCEKNMTSRPQRRTPISSDSRKR